MPITGDGYTGPPAPSLYSDTLPPTIGTPSAVQASASACTDSLSCHAIGCFSGLPKLRLLVAPSGRAPAHARFAAHSNAASSVPTYGSAATRRPLQSMLTASALPSGSASTAASACSGRRTVRDCTIASYCSNSGLREERLGLRRSASSASVGAAPAASVAGGGGYGGAPGLRGSRSYSG